MRSYTRLVGTSEMRAGSALVSSFPVSIGCALLLCTFLVTCHRNRETLESGADTSATAKENADVVSAVGWLRSQPFVDAARVSVAGCSFGVVG